MAISKVILDGSTLLDVTNSTVNSQRILQGYTAKGADGVDVTGAYVPPTFNTQSKSVSPSESQQTVTPDSGYDGLSSVTVGAISSTYVGSGITRRSSTDLTASGATVTVPAGYYQSQATKSVASGTAGTPTATKGSVSNHAVSVTPSVTNTAGYIAGGTETGTAVTVSASELVSGTLNVTSSGTKDVTNYASASVAAGGATASATKGAVSNHSVAVTPSVTRTAGYVTAGTANGTAVTVSASELVSGSETKTANGTYDVTNLAELVVNVSGGGGGDEFKAMIQRTANVITALPSDITTIGAGAFHSFSSLVLTSLPSSVTSIGDYAFYNCNLMRLSSLPSGLTTIGQYAFYGCSGLTVSSLPSSLTSLGQNAFYNCDGLTQMDLSATTITSLPTYAFSSCHNLASVSIPSTVTSIGVYAFNACKSLMSVSCNGAITTLGSYSFTGNSSFRMQLEHVSFPNAAISSFTTAFGATTASNACQQLETADIGSTSAIAATAFANCYKLQTLVLRKTGSICTLNNVSAFTNTPMSGYNGLTGTVYVPSALISTYKNANNWSTLYNGGTLTFSAIEGSVWEL